MVCVFIEWSSFAMNILSRMLTFVLIFYKLNPHFMLLKCVMLCAELLPEVNCGLLNMSSGSSSKATEAERCCINPSPTASFLSGITVGDRLHPRKDTGQILDITMDKSPAHG